MRFLKGAGLILPALALAACGAAAATPSDQVNPVITVAEATATNGAVSSVQSYSGSVTPRWTVSVLPKASGQVTDLKVQQGQTVKQGEIIAILDSRNQKDQITQAQANLTSAQAKLNSMLAGPRSEDVTSARAQAAAAQAAVTNLATGRPEAVTAAQANLTAAQQKLASAQAGGRPESIAQAQAKLDADNAALSKLLNGPSPQDITNAQLAVEGAKDRLYADQTLYDRQVSQGIASKEQRQAALDVDQTAIDQANTSLAKVTAPPRTEDVNQLKAAVDADKQSLAIAQQPNRPEDIAALQQAVKQAESGLAQAKQPGSQAAISQAQQQANAAQASAVKAATPYTAEDIAQAKTAVDVQQASLQIAQSALTDTTITAPATGLISDVPIAVGSLVGPQSAVATLISPDLEVDASVEEAQVNLFKADQTVVITGAANQTLNGKVFLVSPSADAKTRKFTVKVAPPTGDTTLKSGMSATVKIQTGQQQNAVLVPKDAVIQRNGQQIVFTDENGRAKLNVVQTGLSDDKSVQITSGLTSGAKVILPGSIDLADGDAVSTASSQSGAPSPSASTSPSGPTPAPKS